MKSCGRRRKSKPRARAPAVSGSNRCTGRAVSDVAGMRTSVKPLREREYYVMFGPDGGPPARSLTMLGPLFYRTFRNGTAAKFVDDALSDAKAGRSMTNDIRIDDEVAQAHGG